VGPRLRAGRRTNLALLALLAVALLTGALAFAIGGGWAWWAVAAHAVAGFGILLLSPWKSVISARGLRRGTLGSAASVALSVLVAAAVLSGIAHAVGVWTEPAAMRVHVGAALLSIPLLVWHVLARPVRPRRTDLSRRSLLRAGAIAGGSIAVAGAVEGVVRLTGIRGADRRVTGSYERGSFDPEAMPVTQWLDDSPPGLDRGRWRLEVRTAAGARSWTADELAAFDDRVRAVLDCTGGWYAQQDWAGVRLDRLVGEAGEARSVLVVSATGYARRFPASDAAALVLATRVGGTSLSVGHGAPARLVAPGRRGFWWVKWVVRVEASPMPWWWQSPFPLT
jgi:hypothetical protein